MAGERGTVIITGASSGIGLATARAVLATSPALSVVVTSPDTARAAAAARALDHERAIPLQLDLGSLHGVKGFVERLTEMHRRGALPSLRASICNAAVQVVDGMKLSEDGFELTFAVNHLGHFALVQRLLPHLEVRARIIVIASNTHDPDQKTGMPAPLLAPVAALAHPNDDEAADPCLRGRVHYTTSKLHNVLFTYALARRLREDPAALNAAQAIAVNAFDPGFTPGTGLARRYPAVMRVAFRYVLPFTRRLSGRPNALSERGIAIARLALAPELDAVTGRYFNIHGELASSAASREEDRADELWARSLALISPPETRHGTAVMEPAR
jgi:NAD(P)-dependent dehydrogenase (short-subunit alcohol dehydrogenase family)